MDQPKASDPNDVAVGVEPPHDHEEGPEPPPPGIKLMAIVRWVLIIMVAFAAAGAWWSFAQTETTSQMVPKYQCPMHPQIVSDQPGECPICHMALEPISEERKGQGQGHGQAQHEHMPSGTTDISLTLDRMQAIGVRTTPAESKPIASTLRATAVVEAPEQNVAEVHVRTPGFVEGISVRETGIQVGRGQTLFSIYSPEIYQAQSELLAAKGWAGLGPDPSAKVGGARAKLELLGVSSKVADKVLAEGKPTRTVGISAPIGGFITQKNVVLGSYVTPEMVLYQIVDLSRVYIVADIFQQSMNNVKVGMVGRFTSSTREGVAEAKVDLVYPRVDANARTTRVRMQVDNRKLKYLPGEYGFVEFESPSREVITIPRDALVDTGKDKYVFVEGQEGHFIPRLVVVGEDLGSGQGLVVLEGLKAGERVVSGATFLVDSESRLRASIASATEAPSASGSAPGSAVPEPPAPPHRH